VPFEWVGGFASLWVEWIIPTFFGLGFEILT